MPTINKILLAATATIVSFFGFFSMAIYLFFMLAITIGFFQKIFSNFPDPFFETVFYFLFYGLQILAIVVVAVLSLQKKLYAISIGIALGFISYLLLLITMLGAFDT